MMEAMQTRVLLVPSDDMSHDSEALLEHHDSDNGRPVMIEAWATPALHDLNPDAFGSYSQARVHAVMQNNARRIHDGRLERLKCVAPSNDTSRMTGIGSEQDRSREAHHHRELVTVILAGLMVECAWLVWFVSMPYSAMLFLLASLASCRVAYAYRTTPSVEEQPPHLRDKGLMNVDKLPFWFTK